MVFTKTATKDTGRLSRSTEPTEIVRLPVHTDDVHSRRTPHAVASGDKEAGAQENLPGHRSHLHVYGCITTGLDAALLKYCRVSDT